MFKKTFKDKCLFKHSCILHFHFSIWLLLYLMPWIYLELQLWSRKDSQQLKKQLLPGFLQGQGRPHCRSTPWPRTFHTDLWITKKKPESYFLGYFIRCDKILTLQKEERHSDIEAWSQTEWDMNVFLLDLSSVTWGIGSYQLGEVQEIVLIDILSSKLFF